MTATSTPPAGGTQGASPSDQAQSLWGLGWPATITFGAAIVFSVFQIWTSAFSPIASQITRSLHVGFLLLLTFALFANTRRLGLAGKLFDWGLGLAGFALSFYHLYFYNDIVLRAGSPNPEDLVVGVLVIALVFEAGRRVMGYALPLICGAFLAYCLFGEYLPSPLNHRGFDLGQVIDHMYLGTEGIYGVPIFVSSTYIFLFILFGSFLEQAGMVRLFTDVAMGTVGHQRGGPAKVAVVSSGMMGTINGSGVANVVTTGQFTIPLMIRFGYTRPFAGAVEATASMGGQIMPPVMGAVAFIMAETLGVDYVEIVKAAIIPAVMYFVTVFWMVHLEAYRRNLKGLPKIECPDALAALRRNWHLILPLAILVYLLFNGFTPLFAGTAGLIFTVVLILGAAIARQIGPVAIRFAFWIVIGVAASFFFNYGIGASFGLIGALALVTLFVKGGVETLRICRNSMADGARHALPVGIACALVGIIIGTMTLTGIATNFARVIVSVGESSLFLSLVLTMIACLILGMGIPTIPNYIITSSLAGPALLELGVPLIVSHMFVFYFGIMADLTPPVALAAFAASSIAKAPGLAIGMQCLRIAIAGFVVPFMAVYTPALMLQDGGPLAASIGYWPAVAYIVCKCLLSIGLWGIATIGHLTRPVTWFERLVACAAAFSLVAALPITDEIGFGLAILFFALHAWRLRRSALKPAKMEGG